MRYPLVAVLLLCPALASAQSASDNKAAADALFDEGKRLVAAGDVDHACQKFAASLQLLDQLGVRLNLADCHERLGQTATAWAEFREAASLAEKRGDKRAGATHKRVEALAARLVKLQISVPPTNRVPGLVVRRDGVAVPSDAFDSELPVNPGSYTIDATAPGYQPWSTHVSARSPGQVVTVDVPALVMNKPVEPPRPIAHEPVAPPPVEPKPVPPSQPAQTANVDKTPSDGLAATDNPQHKRHVLGIAIGAGGVAALGVGVVLGFEAKSKWDSVGSHCSSGNVCDATGVSINHSATTLGNAGTIVGSVGLAALVTGAVLYLTAPSARPMIEHARLEVDGNAGVQVGFVGRF